MYIYDPHSPVHWLPQAKKKDAGGISCGIHFPGHGASAQDTFFEAAVCFEEDIENHLSPFRDLIEALPSIMIGHIEYPLIDDEGRPASEGK